MHYQAVYQKIDYKRYQFLREHSGLSPKTEEAARLGMENSLCCVAILDEDNDNEIVGMGRIVGDGACHCQVKRARPDRSTRQAARIGACR